MKSILIPTEDHDAMPAVLDAALLVAKTFDSYIEGIAVRPAAGTYVAVEPVSSLAISGAFEHDAELAAQARTAPVARQLAALAEWVGKDGREVDEAGDLTPDGLAGAAAALGVDADELAFLWECALSVEWLAFDNDDEDRVVPGETADDWASGGDEPVFAAWALTLSAVLGEALEFYGPETDEEEDEDDEDDKKKKKGKKKVKTAAATNGKAEAKAKPKVKTDVEVDEDDD